MRFFNLVFLFSFLTILNSQNILSLTNVNTSAGTLDVHMENTDVVGGFQFGLAGVSITGASGGSATAVSYTHLRAHET